MLRLVDARGAGPDQAEVHGLVALMEFQASRLRARVSPSGEPILLSIRTREWTSCSSTVSQRSSALERRRRAGPYSLQAEIAACHARARPRSSRLGADRRALQVLGPSSPHPSSAQPRRGRGMASGRAQASRSWTRSARSPRRELSLLPAVRGDFLSRLGRFAEAEASSSAPQRSRARA